VDGNLNRSGDSNVANANTPPDTTPPTTPVLEASVLGPSQVKLTWTRSSDDLPLNCCLNNFEMNGAPLTQYIQDASAPDGKWAVIIRHLTPGSTNTFVVKVGDYSGNFASSNSATASCEPSSDTIPPTAPTNLHLVRDDTGGEVWIGWTEATDETDSQDEIEYEIYVDGVLSPLGASAGINFDFVYGKSNADNIFTVKAVDRSGNTSAASAPLRLFLQ
jgi:chitinase